MNHSISKYLKAVNIAAHRGSCGGRWAERQRLDHRGHQGQAVIYQEVNMAKSSGLIIYESFFKVIDRKSDEDRLALYDALARYHFKGEEPEGLPDHLADCFELMRPNLDKSSARYDACVANGSKGGRPRKNQSEKPNERIPIIKHHLFFICYQKFSIIPAMYF